MYIYIYHIYFFQMDSTERKSFNTVIYLGSWTSNYYRLCQFIIFVLSYYYYLVANCYDEQYVCR